MIIKKFVPAILILASCSLSDRSTEARNEIITADTLMSSLATKEGFFKALLAYADDSVIKPKEGELSVIGKQALEKYWSGKADTKAITWAPFRVEASKSGDMGYTIGNWKLAAKDTAFYGNYYAIWKKQPDGKWKFVVDGGNSTPSPQ
jgi:ketosteroid isomerase-like protein